MSQLLGVIVKFSDSNKAEMSRQMKRVISNG